MNTDMRDVKGAMEEITYALETLRDCGDRPGMYEDGKIALEHAATVQAELSHLQEQNESLLRDNETLGILNETLKQQLETCRGLLKQALDENIRLRTALTMIRDHRSPGGSQLISGREAEAIAWAALQPSGGAGLADPSDLSRAPVAGATPPVSNPASGSDS